MYYEENASQGAVPVMIYKQLSNLSRVLCLLKIFKRYPCCYSN